MTSVRLLTGAETDGLATLPEYISAVREAYRKHGNGGGAEPPYIVRDRAESGKIICYGAVPDAGGMGGYVYSAGFSADDAWFVTPLFDAETGELLAIVDGGRMNPYKTAATGAVAADELSRPDAEVATIIGSGPQAYRQLEALLEVRDISTVYVHSRTPENREAFARVSAANFGISVEPVGATDDAVRNADIIVTATTASEPVFDGTLVRPGTHITAMGQNDPEKRELDEHVLSAATYVPDLRDRIRVNAGAYLLARKAGAIPDDHVHADLGAVVADRASGRRTDDEITIFDSSGTGIETAAAAYLLYENAVSKGIGREIEWEPASEAYGSAPIDQNPAIPFDEE